MTLSLRLRALMPLLFAAVLLASCAAEAPEEASGPDQTPAETDPDDAEAAESGDDAGTDDAETDDAESAAGDAPEANRTEGCVEDPSPGTDHFPDKVAFEHAEHASVTYHDSHKVLEVDVDFDTEPLRFVLVQCGLETPALEGDLAEATVVEVPVESFATLTTANLPHLDALDAVDRLVGVATPGFVTTESVVEAIDEGGVDTLADADGGPDHERIIAADPQVVVLDAFGETVVDDASRLADADVATLLNTDFNEATPLGRAEWLKVTALLLNREVQAEEAFADIAAGYEEVRQAVADVEERPRVLLDEPFEGTWFAAGGESLTAQAIEDAGGEYVFADDDSTGSLSFDIETVLDRGADADVWIGAGSVHGSLDELVARDERFAALEAVESERVWAGDARTSPEGGNARFERALLRADELLADFAAILHPDLVDHDPIYYGPVGSAAQ